MLLFLTFATFNVSFAWDVFYFHWEVIAQGSIAGYWVIYQLGDRDVKAKTFPLILLTCFRLLWEVIAAIWYLDINDERGVMVLFLVAIGVTTYLSFRPGGYLPKWLDKRLKEVNL